MGATTKKIVKNSPAGFRRGYSYDLIRYLKRSTARARRRAEKRDIENAPEQNRSLTKGWSD